MSQIVNKMRGLMSTVGTLLMPKGYTDVESVNRFPPGPKMFAANLETVTLPMRNAIFSGPFIAAFAIFLGFDVLQISIVFSLMQLSRFLHHFGIWLSQKISNKKYFALSFMMIAILLTGFLPLLLIVQNNAIRFLLFLAIMVAKASFYSIGGAVYCTWLRLQEESPQGVKFLRNRPKVILISSTITLLIGAAIVQKLPDIAEYIPVIGQAFIHYGPQISALMTIFWLVTLITSLSFVPQIIFAKKQEYKTSKLDSLKSIFATIYSSNNRILLTISFLIGAGFYSMSELFIFHVQKNLEMTLIFSASLLISMFSVGFFTNKFWEYLVNRFGMRPVLRFICLTSVIIIPISAFLATTQTSAFLFITASAIGFYASGINAILPKFPMRLVQLDKQSAVFAVVSSLIGVGGSLGVAIAGLTMHFAGQNALPTFLGIQVLPYHFTGIEGAIFFLLAFFIGYKITEPGAARLRDLMIYLVRRAIRLGRKELAEEKTKDSSDNSKEDK